MGSSPKLGSSRTEGRKETRNNTKRGYSVRRPSNLNVIGPRKHATKTEKAKRYFSKKIVTKSTTKPAEIEE